MIVECDTWYWTDHFVHGLMWSLLAKIGSFIFFDIPCNTYSFEVFEIRFVVDIEKTVKPDRHGTCSSYWVSQKSILQFELGKCVNFIIKKNNYSPDHRNLVIHY